MASLFELTNTSRPLLALKISMALVMPLSSWVTRVDRDSPVFMSITTSSPANPPAATMPSFTLVVLTWIRGKSPTITPLAPPDDPPSRSNTGVAFRVDAFQCTTLFSLITYASCLLVAHTRFLSWKCTKLDRTARVLCANSKNGV
jgi:hypothetical protein